MEIQRNQYLQKIINRMHNGMVKVVTGIRRSGKSYLLLNLFYRYLIQSGYSGTHVKTKIDKFLNESSSSLCRI